MKRLANSRSPPRRLCATRRDMRSAADVARCVEMLLRGKCLFARVHETQCECVYVVDGHGWVRRRWRWLVSQCDATNS